MSPTTANPGYCNRCGAPVPVNPDNGEFWRLQTFWRGNLNQVFEYCSVDCLRRAAIQGLVNEATEEPRS